MRLNQTKANQSNFDNTTQPVLFLFLIPLGCRFRLAQVVDQLEQVGSMIKVLVVPVRP